MNILLGYPVKGKITSKVKSTSLTRRTLDIRRRGTGA